MKKNKPSHLLARDQIQLELAKLLCKWRTLEISYAVSIRRVVLPNEVVEDVISQCIRYGLFEEARQAAMFRRERGLRTAEVDEALKTLLLKFTPYSPLNTLNMMREAELDRYWIHIYPPFVELLQAASDDFRSFIKKECL